MGAGPSARGGHLLGSELMTLNGSHTGKRKGRHPKAAFLGVTPTFGASEGQASGQGPLSGREGARCFLRRCLPPSDSFVLVLQAGMLGVLFCFAFLLSF